jgi:hypothetical protein
VEKRKVGDAVAVQIKYNTGSIITGTVVKITPTGKVDVKYDNCEIIKRFNPDGDMFPQDRCVPVYLLSSENSTEIIEWYLKKKAADETVGQDELLGEIDRLQGLLDVAKQKLFGR